MLALGDPETLDCCCHAGSAHNVLRRHGEDPRHAGADGVQNCIAPPVQEPDVCLVCRSVRLLLDENPHLARVQLATDSTQMHSRICDAVNELSAGDTVRNLQLSAMVGGSAQDKKAVRTLGRMSLTMRSHSA